MPAETITMATLTYTSVVKYSATHLPRCLRWPSHSAHRTETVFWRSRVQFPSWSADFMFEFQNLRLISQGFDGVLYNLW